MSKVEKAKKKEPMSEDKLEIGMKILRGARLTQIEFDMAYRWGFLIMDAPKEMTMSELYQEYDKRYYEDDLRFGYLCIRDGKIGSSVLSVSEDGKRTTICMYGVHREHVKPEYLRPEQKQFW